MDKQPTRTPRAIRSVAHERPTQPHQRRPIPLTREQPARPPQRQPIDFSRRVRESRMTPEDSTDQLRAALLSARSPLRSRLLLAGAVLVLMGIAIAVAVTAMPDQPGRTVTNAPTPAEAEPTSAPAAWVTTASWTPNGERFSIGAPTKPLTLLNDWGERCQVRFAPEDQGGEVWVDCRDLPQARP